MTQAELAEKLNVSRTTVSRWETGRMVPDIDTAKAVSGVLGFDLISDGKENKTEEKTKRLADRGKWIALSAVFVLSVMVCLAVIFMRSGPDDNGHRAKMPSYSREWFMTEDVRKDNQAFLRLEPEENPVYAFDSELFSSGRGWLYAISIYEESGIGFTVSEVVEVHFQANNDRQTVMKYTKDQFAEWFRTDRVEQGMRHVWTGGMPVQTVDTIGLIVRGVDDYGNELEFHVCLELKDEEKEDT